MNLLHSIKARGNDSLVNAVIEIPTGSFSKIEYDENKDDFVVDRVLSTNLSFPFNYGFIPETWEKDNDPLDIVVLSSKPIKTGSVVESRIIGMLITTDEKGKDAKLITVENSEKSPVFSGINTIDDLDKQTLDNIEYFYKNYKIIEPGKWVDIDGYAGKEEAEKKLTGAIELYHQHFQK